MTDLSFGLLCKQMVADLGSIEACLKEKKKGPTVNSQVPLEQAGYMYRLHVTSMCILQL